MSSSFTTHFQTPVNSSLYKDLYQESETKLQKLEIDYIVLNDKTEKLEQEKKELYALIKVLKEQISEHEESPPSYEESEGRVQIIVAEKPLPIITYHKEKFKKVGASGYTKEESEKARQELIARVEKKQKERLALPFEDRFFNSYESQNVGVTYDEFVEWNTIETNEYGHINSKQFKVSSGQRRKLQHGASGCGEARFHIENITKSGKYRMFIWCPERTKNHKNYTQKQMYASVLLTPTEDNNLVVPDYVERK
jgi:guanylate kinase